MGDDLFLYYGTDGNHLERSRDLELFKGYKLIIGRLGGVRAASLFQKEPLLIGSNFNILILKKEYENKFLYFFEAIINSKLALFYLSSYQQRPKGNYSKVNKSDLEGLPIPDIDDIDKKEIIEAIIEKVKLLKENIENNDISDIDGLIYDLYELDYYERLQVDEYFEIHFLGRKKIVNDIDFKSYISQFQNSFDHFIKPGYLLNAECKKSEFIGALIKFTLSKKGRNPKFDSLELKKLTALIEKENIDYTNEDIFKEEKIRIYDDNNLYIYKSNQYKDWTQTKAINDVKDELDLIIKNFGDKNEIK